MWLGLSSGLLVFFLGITGCILAFEVEIRTMTEPFRNVQADAGKGYLLPSQLRAIRENQMVAKKALCVEYAGVGKGALAYYYDLNNYEIVFLNPYTGTVLKHKKMNKDFFRLVLDGHFYLWLPPRIGQPIVTSATLVFLIMMITGLILWWPRNRVARKQRFSIKWNATFKRKNYDLHNVLGFYMTWVAIFIAITGLVFGFEWFAKSLYWVTSGGQERMEEKHPVSDTLQKTATTNMADYLWQQHSKDVKPNESIAVYFANVPTDPVEIVINHKPGTYYDSDFFHYDRFTGKLLVAQGSYDGKFKDAELADKIVRMNYDIHVGAILGLPGKIVAFFASLLAASLPITGFLIWRGRKKKGHSKINEERRRVLQKVNKP